MSSQDLGALDRDIQQPLSRVIQEAFADGIKRVFSKDSTYAFGLQIYPSISGSPTIDSYAGQFIYMGDIGSATVGNWFGIMLGLKVLNAPTTESAFLRLYNHGSEAIDSAFYFANSGGTPVTNLLKFAGQIPPVEATGSGGSTRSHRIPCLVADVTYYLSLYTD